jgi:hypothetical protein
MVVWVNWKGCVTNGCGGRVGFVRAGIRIRDLRASNLITRPQAPKNLANLPEAKINYMCFWNMIYLLCCFRPNAKQRCQSPDSNAQSKLRRKKTYYSERKMQKISENKTEGFLKEFIAFCSCLVRLEFTLVWTFQLHCGKVGVRLSSECAQESLINLWRKEE